MRLLEEEYVRFVGLDHVLHLGSLAVDATFVPRHDREGGSRELTGGSGLGGRRFRRWGAWARFGRSTGSSREEGVKAPLRVVGLIVIRVVPVGIVMFFQATVARGKLL